MPVARPPRTEAHVQRAQFIQQFADAGLQASIGTNGSNPEADIQFVKVPAGEARNRDELDGAIECWITQNGQARLDARLSYLKTTQQFLDARLDPDGLNRWFVDQNIEALPDHAPGAWETSE